MNHQRPHILTCRVGQFQWIVLCPAPAGIGITNRRAQVAGFGGAPDREHGYRFGRTDLLGGDTRHCIDALIPFDQKASSLQAGHFGPYFLQGRRRTSGGLGVRAS